MKVQAPPQAFVEAATQLQQCLVKGMDTPLVAGAEQGQIGFAVRDLHFQVSRDVSRMLGMHPKGFSVPSRFDARGNVDVTFSGRMNWDHLVPEYSVLYNIDALQTYFDGGQYTYPVGTRAPFSVPKGAILLYMVAHAVTSAMHWMNILKGLPNPIQYREDTEQYRAQHRLFFGDGGARQFVDGFGELGALMCLRNSEHPVAQKFAALHFTTRLIEAAHRMGSSLELIGAKSRPMMRYFTHGERHQDISDQAVQCYKAYPDWIVGQQRYEGELNDPRYYAVGLLKVGNLVFSGNSENPDLTRLDLTRGLVAEDSTDVV